MIKGAILGAIGGVAVMVFFLMKRKGARAAFLKAFSDGGAVAARAALDDKLPRQAKVGGYSLMMQRERLGGLTLLGDFDQIESELSALKGQYAAQVQVRAFGLLCLVLGGPDPDDALRRYDALTAELEAKGGFLLKAVRKQVAAWVKLARAQRAPVGLDSADRTVLHNTVGTNGLSELVLWKALIAALRMAGADGQADKFQVLLKAASPPFA